MAEATVNRFFIFRYSKSLVLRQICRYNRQPMHEENSFTSLKRTDRPALLALSLLFSILLHLLVVFFLPYEQLTTEKTDKLKEKPTIVRLIDKPEADKPKEYELDQRPPKTDEKPPVESKRLAENNQRVEKEMAPQGEDTRDQQAQAASPKPPAMPAQTQPTRPKAQPQTTQKETVEKPTKTTTAPAATESHKQFPQEPSLPTIEQLTQLTPNTVGRIVQNELALKQKIKERTNLETGDRVWLNLTQGRLISFFRRFRNQIEGVWNYPREAIEREIQGRLLLQITVDRNGELIDVNLLQSSGYDILDFEAIQAIYRAAPFGPLGKHYQHPDLKIMAHFEYRISGKYIYGEKR